MSPLFERLFQLLLPQQCHCCENFLDEGQQGICPDCLSEIEWIQPPFCLVCGTPFLSREIKSHTCSHCLTHRKYFTTARALGAYQGSLREAIHRWKYQGNETLTAFFGQWMGEGFSRYWDPKDFDLLIPVPLYRKRLRERGYNQALLLAKELSRRTGIPFRKKTLLKVKSTPPQVNLSESEREKGLKGSFEIFREEEVRGKRVLLVDDVYTTGATVNECSKVLMTAGAKRVDIFTLAHALKNY